jgi:uncharacterized protein (TIGR03435 family)
MRSALLLAIAAAAYAQAPAFDVATIKPADPNGSVAIRRSGYRIATTSTSLLFLITWAYDVHSDLVFGKPAWLDSIRYDIVANAPHDDRSAGPAPLAAQPTDFKKLMQALLAERFHLVLRRETRELPIYALVTAKGGPKFRLTEAPAVAGQTPFRMTGAGRLAGEQVSAEMLAKALSGQLDRSVQDQTGLQGVFDFQLAWEPEMAHARVEGASLFTAIQEQLGLKLESRKGPVEVLVIERIESVPTGN